MKNFKQKKSVFRKLKSNIKYMENIKLSNIAVNLFKYYENKFRNDVECLPIEIELCKLYDEEIIEYFKKDINLKKYLKLLVKFLIDNPIVISYYFSYNKDELKGVVDLIKSLKDNENLFNIVITDLFNKNKQEISNWFNPTIEDNIKRNIDEDCQDFYNTVKRKLGIKYTWDYYKDKNIKLKNKILNDGFLNENEINIISNFADYSGYGWMYIWKNINNITIDNIIENESKFENEKPVYIGRITGDLLTSKKYTIFVNGIKFQKNVIIKIDTNSFW